MSRYFPEELEMVLGGQVRNVDKIIDLQREKRYHNQVNSPPRKTSSLTARATETPCISLSLSLSRARARGHAFLLPSIFITEALSLINGRKAANLGSGSPYTDRRLKN